MSADKTTAPTRIGLIGCGFFAGNHLNAWRQLKDQGADLVAVCDTDEAKARSAAERFGVARHYTDASQMLASENLDMVDIVTQVRSHKALALLCIKAGVATIVQKPFGLTLEECADMTAAAKAAGVPLCVHENFRFQLPLRHIRRALDAGAIGEPSWARISFRTGYDIYKGQPYLLDEERFIINDVGTHVLDLARFLLGEVQTISAEIQRRRPDLAGEDTATMMLRHENGAVSVVECTYESRRTPDLFPQTLIELEGPGGAISLEPDYSVRVTSGDLVTITNCDPDVLDWMERPWHGIQDSVVATCAHILEAFRAGREPETSASDNFRTMALCDAAYTAAEGTRARPRELKSLT